MFERSVFYAGLGVPEDEPEVTAPIDTADDGAFRLVPIDGDEGGTTESLTVVLPGETEPPQIMTVEERVVALSEAMHALTEEVALLRRVIHELPGGKDAFFHMQAARTLREIPDPPATVKDKAYAESTEATITALIERMRTRGHLQ